MKKILFAFLLLLMPFMVSAVENVKIKDIDELDKSDGVTVNTDPTFEGLKINFDFKFTNLNDFVKYKVTIKNEDDQEYEIESGVSFSEGEYIKYEFGMNGDSSIIKPGETKEMTLQITYVNEPSPDKFVNGKYIEENTMSIDLSTKDGQHSSVDPASLAKEDNPKTGATSVLIFITILLVAGVILTVAIRKNDKVLMTLVLLLIPISIYALEKITIDIETKIEIGAPLKEGKMIYFGCNTSPQYNVIFTYRKGITMSTFLQNPTCYREDSDFDYNYECKENLPKSIPVKPEFEACMATPIGPDVDEYDRLIECVNQNTLVDLESEELLNPEEYYLEDKDNAAYVYVMWAC